MAKSMVVDPMDAAKSSTSVPKRSNITATNFILARLYTNSTMVTGDPRKNHARFRGLFEQKIHAGNEQSDIDDKHEERFRDSIDNFFAGKRASNHKRNESQPRCEDVHFENVPCAEYG